VIDAIHLCTCIGGDITSSEQVPGIVIPYTPISVRVWQMSLYLLQYTHYNIYHKRSIGTKTYIAIFGVPLQEHSKMSLVARFTSPLALKQWQNEEEQILKDMAIRIAQAGANIVSHPTSHSIGDNLIQVISSGTIHKYILHWLDLHGIVVIQSVPKSDLIAISEATCAKIIYQTSLFDKLGTLCFLQSSISYLLIFSDLGKANSFDILSISGEDYSHINVPDAVCCYGTHIYILFYFIYFTTKTNKK
jgi:chaperonin GroEL (HSP60 family)